MSSKSKLQSIGALAGATALVLSLALAGCSSQEQTAPETEAEEQSAPEEGDEATLANDDIEIPEIVSKSTDSHKTLIADPDSADPSGFDELPTRDMDIEVEAPDITEVDEESSKAPSGYMYLSEGGIQMAVPSDWRVSRDEDGFVFTNAKGTVLGFMFGTKKRANTVYDFDAIVQSIPQHELSIGYTDVEIISTNTLTTEAGKSCGKEVLFWESYDGGELIHYVSFIESKNYINTVEFMAAPNDFTAETETIGGIINSLVFAEGEIL